uniref:Uncharacterized protein n=1 Tax=Trichuris muris TaxID=70415 RepID=A0A5S6Q893_TRIMR
MTDVRWRCKTQVLGASRVHHQSKQRYVFGLSKVDDCAHCGDDKYAQADLWLCTLDIERRSASTLQSQNNPSFRLKAIATSQLAPSLHYGRERPLPPNGNANVDASRGCVQHGSTWKS